jgi:hypothetical protein
MKCNTCNHQYSVTCDWNQGRCPHHPPAINMYSMRFYNLMQFIKNIFKGKTP